MNGRGATAINPTSGASLRLVAESPNYPPKAAKMERSPNAINPTSGAPAPFSGPAAGGKNGKIALCDQSYLRSADRTDM
jgi:hypothetical protein